MKEKKDIELSVFKKNGNNAEYLDIKDFDDEIEFINFDKAPSSLTDRIKNITKISNRELLLVTTIFFSFFVICEVIGGLASSSLSLLGDAGAMMIDVCSYGFNFFAEHMKSKEAAGAKSSMAHDCVIEILIPGVSVLSLLVVTGWVCSDSILRLLGHKKENVNVAYLYSFAVANLVVDVLCTWLFYVRREDVFLQPSKEKGGGKEGEGGEGGGGGGEDTDTAMGGMMMFDQEDVEIVFSSDTEDSEDDEMQSKSKNLNMISAFTHVGGDTLRSFTVLLAAIASSTFDIDPTLTDAVAAIVVSVTIVVAVMPLIYSLGLSVMEYKRRFSGIKSTKENYRGVNTEAEDDHSHNSSSHSLVEQEEGGGFGGFSCISSSNSKNIRIVGNRDRDSDRDGEGYVVTAHTSSAPVSVGVVPPPPSSSGSATAGRGAVVNDGHSNNNNNSNSKSVGNGAGASNSSSSSSISSNSNNSIDIRSAGQDDENEDEEEDEITL